MMPADFQHVQKPLVVKFLIDERMRDRMVHARLCRKMAHAVKLMFPEQTLECRIIADIVSVAGVAPLFFQQRVPVAFQLHRVVIVEIIQADYFMAVL